MENVILAKRSNIQAHGGISAQSPMVGDHETLLRIH